MRSLVHVPLDSFVILTPPPYPVRDAIMVLSSVAISYHHQIHSLHFSSLITEPQTSLTHNDRWQWSYHPHLLGTWVLIYFTVSFADIIRHTITFPFLLFIVFLCYHICVIFFSPEK